MTVVKKNLDRKRADALIRIAQTTVGTSLTAAVPTPALETAKILGIAAADAWLFWDIYRIYFDRSLSSKRLEELLGQAGIVIFAGGVIGYAAIKLSQSLINEFLNAAPLIGWAVSGLMTGTSTLAVGLGWMMFVEERYRTSLTVVPVTEVDREELPHLSVGNHRQRMEIEEETTAVTYSNGALHGARMRLQDSPSAEVQSAPGIEDGVDRVELLHPEGKRSVTIDRHKVELIRNAILDALRAQDEVGFKELIAAVDKRLTDFEGSISWYVTVVKLDLEARGIIERIEGSGPQRLRLKPAGST